METMVRREPSSAPLTASPNLAHERRSTALLERRACARLRVRVVVVTLTLLPPSSRRYSITVRWREERAEVGPVVVLALAPPELGRLLRRHRRLHGSLSLARTPRALGLWGCGGEEESRRW